MSSSYDFLKDDVYLIIPAHNRKVITLGCLHRLQSLGLLQQCSVIVVDDGSTDGTSAAIENNYPEVVLLYGDGNLWWTGAIKLGMEYAYSRGCEFIIWLNDDCYIEHHQTISGLVLAARSHPNSIVGSSVLESAESAQIAFGGKRKNGFTYKMIEPTVPDLYPCDLLCGNLVCMPTTIIDSIGYPDSEICPHYGGDFLFLIQARQYGYSLLLDTRYPAFNATIEHTSQAKSDKWLTGDISTRQILGQVFQPESFLSWKLWWVLFKTDYPIFGVSLFLVKYFRLIALLFIISILRLLPKRQRQYISDIKRTVLPSR